MRVGWPVALGVVVLMSSAGPVYSQCDCCPASQIAFTASIGSGNCGQVQRSDGSLFLNLACGGLYFGGGGNSVPLPALLSDTWQWVAAVTSCDSGTGGMTLGATTAAEVGARKCTSNGCLFGPPIPIPNPSSTPTSTCVINTVSADATGTANCNTGSVNVTLPVSGEIYLTGDLLPGTAGIQPCPLCTGPVGFETCQGGPNDALPCTPENSASISTAYPTSHDCPPAPVYDIGPLAIFPFVFTTGQVTTTAIPGTGGSIETRVFCGYCRDADNTTDFQAPPTKCIENATSSPLCSQPYEACEQRNNGAFGPAGGAAKTITATGTPSGVCIDDGNPHGATLVTVFCIPPNYNATVDAAADLPGPGAVSLPGSLVWVPGDTDGDGVPNQVDNCPTLDNPAQTDADNGGVGDTCDPCPQDGANLCRHLSGAGPDPSDPTHQSILSGINTLTGGALLPSAATVTARALRAHVAGMSQVTTALSEEVIPFPNVVALTCDRQGTLFAGLGPTGGGLVIRRDLRTGIWTTLGATGQSGFPAGVQGMATSLSGGMFASVASGAPNSACPGGADRLAVVDKTGASSPLATLFGAPYGAGITYMNGLSVNPFSGVLYGVTGNCSLGLAPALYTIATSGPSAGVATLIGFLRDASNRPPAQSPSDLSFARDGTLYASLGGSTGTIIRITPADATFTVVGLTGIPAATEALTFCPALDRFVTYKSKRSASSVKFATTSATLLDTLTGSVTVQLKKPTSVIEPAAAQDPDIENPAVPLTGYQIVAPKGVYPTGVHVVNAVGEIVVDLVKPDRLLVPKALNVPDNFVDHYKCYKVKGKLPAGTPAQTLDNPLDPARSFTLLKPTHLCTPVDTGQGFRNPGVHLMCYKAKLGTGQAKHQGQDGIAIADEFGGTTQLDTIKEDEICVPSLLGAVDG